MKYHSLRQLADIARIFPAFRAAPARLLSLSQRLGLWAVLLERAGGTVQLLRNSESRTKDERNRLREPASPLAVAFADPVLRAQGLTSDTYGDAQRFFGLSHSSFHRIVCHYLYNSGMTVPVEEVCARVLQAAARASRVEGLMCLFGLDSTGLVTRLLVKSYA